MSCREYTECNLNAQSDLHIGTNRFALTTTVNLTTHEERVKKDREWLGFKASSLEYARYDAPASLKLTILALLQRKNAPALPKVSRDKDDSRIVQWQPSSNSSSYSSCPSSTIRPAHLNQSAYLIPIIIPQSNQFNLPQVLVVTPGLIIHMHLGLQTHMQLGVQTLMYLGEIVLTRAE